MKSFSHWTPRYVFFRTIEFFYRKSHKGWPWLTYQANYFLDLFLDEDDIGFEIGSGFSTLWLASRIKHLTSVEGDAGWHQRINGLMRERHVANVDYLFVDENKVNDAQLKNQCVEICNALPMGAIDFALIDGLCRSTMALKLSSLLKPGGLLVIDDINWFLPSESRSPSSRSFQQSFLNDEWADFYKAIKNWRVLWTSNGVKDTALYIKPSAY